MKQMYGWALLLLVVALLIVNQGATHATGRLKTTLAPAGNLNPKSNLVGSRVLVPAGYRRINASANSPVHYFRQLPVKPDGAEVLLFNGKPKANQSAQEVVLTVDTGKKDLQQCADAVMRLRAEYLFKQKQYDNIHFNFTSGDRADFTKFAAGYRAVIKGNKVQWVKKAAPS